MGFAPVGRSRARGRRSCRHGGSLGLSGAGIEIGERQEVRRRLHHHAGDRRLQGGVDVAKVVVKNGRAAGVVAAIWFASKVFKIGLLMYGKPPNLATLIRWARQA